MSQIRSRDIASALGLGSAVLFTLFLLVAGGYQQYRRWKERNPSQDCAESLLPTADRIQSELEASAYPLPPRVLRSIATDKAAALSREVYAQPGKKISEAEAEYRQRAALIFAEDRATVDTILSRGALNDAALCLWDMAEAEAAAGHLVEARLAYLKVQRYTHALLMTGRTYGVLFTTRETIASNFSSRQLEFWAPSYAASMQLIKTCEEIPCAGCGRGGAFQHFIAPIRDRFRDAHFPHLTATITRPQYGETLAPDLPVAGTVAEIPESVYADPSFWNKLLPAEEFERLFQQQLYRLTDDKATVAVPTDMSLYVLARVELSDQSYYLSSKAVVDGKHWRAAIRLNAGQENSGQRVELIVAAAYRELPARLDNLPADIWPVAWTKVNAR